MPRDGNERQDGEELDGVDNDSNLGAELSSSDSEHQYEHYSSYGEQSQSYQHPPSQPQNPYQNREQGDIPSHHPCEKIQALSRPRLIRNAWPFTLENAAFIFCDFSDLIVAWYYRTHDPDVSSTYWKSKSILDLLRKHNASIADTSKHVQIIHNCVGVCCPFAACTSRDV